MGDLLNGIISCEWRKDNGKLFQMCSTQKGYHFVQQPWIILLSYFSLTIFSEMYRKPTPKFSSMQEELIFWKSKYEDSEREFEEFRQDSQMLERELEVSLEQAEKTNQELKTKNNHLILENETLKVRTKYPNKHLSFRKLRKIICCRKSTKKNIMNWLVK